MSEPIDSKFRYVLLAAQRAEQLMRGAQAKAEHGNVKHTRAAMNELRDGLIEWGYGAREPEAPAEEELGEFELVGEVPEDFESP